MINRLELKSKEKYDNHNEVLEVKAILFFVNID
jgi:hypothetical protein